jgi:hypothetical protein
MPIPAQGHMSRVEPNMTCIVLLYHHTLHPDLIGGDSHHPHRLLVLRDTKNYTVFPYSPSKQEQEVTDVPLQHLGVDNTPPGRFMSLA